LIVKTPYADLESQYTQQIEILFTLINKEFIAELKKAMETEGIDAEIIRAVKLNAFSDVYKKFKKISDKFKDLSYYRFKTTIMKMAILFENADKRVKKMIVKTFNEARREIPVLKLKEPSQALRGSIQRNIELIHNITKEHVDNLQTAVLHSMRRGFDPKVIQEEVLKQADKGLSYAKFVSRDQLAKAHADINEERQRSVGIPGYIWIDTNDGKTRKSHKAHHMKFYRWDDPPVINFALDGDMKRAPERLHPGEDYQCRCNAQPAFDQSDADLMSTRIRGRTYGK